MSEPCSQQAAITENKTHIEHILPDIQEIKRGVEALRDEVASMKSFAAGVAAAASVFVNVAIKIFSVAAAHAAVLFR